MSDIKQMAHDAADAAKQAKANLDAIPIQQDRQKRFSFQYKISGKTFCGEISAWTFEHAQTLLSDSCHVDGELLEVNHGE